MDTPVYGPVLLVCIYNKYGNILTHDYFYQIFAEYGEIVKILIFEKAKVWKTFVQFTEISSAKIAMAKLNNRIVFEDGSKMNIFSSKLQHVKFQNSNLGGVNYEELKNDQLVDQIQICNRGRRSTMQQYPNLYTESLAYDYQPKPSSFYDPNKSLTGQKQSTFSFVDHSDSFSGQKSQKSWNTFDIDQQFLEIARESEQFRELQKSQQIRRKSKTIVTNPHEQKFVLENSPSKVLFIRSIPDSHCNKSLFNIFSLFGNVSRVIFIKQKDSGLVQFEDLEQAINAKDQLNYAKPTMKIFYSHYATLKLRSHEHNENQDFKQYKYTNSVSSHSAKKTRNPPSETLFLTQIIPAQENQIREQCEKLHIAIQNIQWRLNDNQKWMCLTKFGNIDKSLVAIGFLQGWKLSNGKQLKISFTRSKISKKNQHHYHYQENLSN